MGTWVSASEHKKYLIFLNISFLFVASVPLIITCFSSSEFLVLSSHDSFNFINQHDCKAFEKLDDYKAKCHFMKSNNPCVSQGYIDYLYLFYCKFGGFPILGYFLLFLWLLVLFYLLGNTASEYFCSSLESLSRLLKLSPTIAGVTLLSLGNGAPDVFASLVSFMGSGTGNVGLNTVIGGASFVTCVVVGIISTFMHSRHVRVSRFAFLRDICFFLLVLASLTVILIRGKINLWVAIGFSSMYIVYVLVVYLSGIRCNDEIGRDFVSSDGNDLSVPILYGVEEKREANCLEEGILEAEAAVESKKCCFCLRSSTACAMILCILEMPLYLPRRLTIPVVYEKRWSKPIAVTSVTLAPVLLSVLWNPQDKDPGTFDTSLIVYGIGLLFGVILGVLACVITEKSSPPKRYLFPWHAAGFLMSVIWSYIIAQELVALLVSLGYIFGISPSILGLTVLAWGNSIGDLITNLAMALNGGAEGAQIALSGCYAGPIFNIIFGLGLSLVGSCWYNYPASIVISWDPYLLETVGFLVFGLLWALFVLPRRGMKLDGVMGGGLLAIYLLSMSLRFIQTLGSFQFHHKRYSQLVTNILDAM
ncbi:Cation calcium exchanger [Melia azedarach]|uniref:Cation calcium exchanger n=2 Tax=Melia azedarach TaxID=155640 RepID=A0ACC1YD78_MELAZ|nr:Cation calcium exchanger [Melia azedarach]KAJ4721333.1 Cation calcium exchanger [Melia azedarach]